MVFKRNESRIIINADDFGRQSSINKAIIELFEKGILNSTSLMANMPDFQEAVDLAQQYKIVNRIGIHLVLTEGNPLTKGIRELSYLFNEDENLSILRTKKVFLLKKFEKKYIYDEFAAQIEKVQKENISITHIDTHHQLHDSWSILQIIIPLLKKYQIPFVRILNNLEKNNIYKDAYRHLVNGYLKLRKYNYTDFLGDQNAFSAMKEKNPSFYKNKSVEIMVHPDYNCEKNIVDRIERSEYSFDFIKKLSD